jgi:hypothetical protein
MAHRPDGGGRQRIRPGGDAVKRFLGFVLVALLAGGMAALAQQASGPPTPITPPPSVYTQAPPSLATPRATALRAIAPRAAAPATATTAAEIVRVPQSATLDCGAEIVVWANPATHIYHFSTSDYYGRTKVGSYMCESAAKTQGMRPGRTEVRP